MSQLKIRNTKLFLPLVSLGLALTACQSESIAPLPSVSSPSASASLSSADGLTPADLPSVAPRSPPTPEPTPEVGPRAVYYLKKESSESSKHHLYQVDLETQQTHELDTLDFKACESGDYNLQEISPNRKAVVVYCGGTVSVYDTINRQRIYATPEVLEPLAYGEPVKWPHESPAPKSRDPNAPSAYPSPAVYEPAPAITPIPQATLPPTLEDISFRLFQTHSSQKTLSESFVAFLPESGGTWAVFRRNGKYGEDRYFKVKLEDLTVETISESELQFWRSPNTQRVLKREKANNKLYVMGPQGQNKREIYQGIINQINWIDNDNAFLCVQENENTKIVVLDFKKERRTNMLLPEMLMSYQQGRLCPQVLDVSPDGQHAVIQTRDGSSIDGPGFADLHWLDIQTLAVRRLGRAWLSALSSSSFPFWAKFSPNNRLLFAYFNFVSIDPLALGVDTLTVRENFGQYLNDIKPGVQTSGVYQMKLVDNVESESKVVYEMSERAHYNPGLSGENQWVFFNNSQFYAIDKQTLAIKRKQVSYPFHFSDNPFDFSNVYPLTFTSDGKYVFFNQNGERVIEQIATGKRFTLFDEDSRELVSRILTYEDCNRCPREIYVD